MPAKNDWRSRFGAKRRAIDKALLEACERALAEPDDKKFVTMVEEAVKGPQKPRDESPATLIARAFGRLRT